MSKPTPETLTFEQAQRTLPWTVPYAARHAHDVNAFRSTFMVRHVVLHAMKSLGKIAAELEAVDHSNWGPVPPDKSISIIMNCAADLVSAALKLAEIYGYSLAAVLMIRVREKNGVGFGE